jgi:hypothetical protein
MAKSDFLHLRQIQPVSKLGASIVPKGSSAYGLPEEARANIRSRQTGGASGFRPEPPQHLHHYDIDEADGRALMAAPH